MSAYTYPSVLFQGITFTAKQWGKFPTISFTAGGVAGSEVVTVASDLSNINVQVASGVSTTAQVITAIQATSPSVYGNSAGDLVSMVNTTPGLATAPFTSSAMSGAVAPNTLGYYTDQIGTPLTGTFQTLYFQFNAKWMLLTNDDTAGTNKIVFSWDGINNHGIIGPGQSVTIDTLNANVIYLKDQNGAPAYRLMAKPL